MDKTTLAAVLLFCLVFVLIWQFTRPIKLKSWDDNPDFDHYRDIHDNNHWF